MSDILALFADSVNIHRGGNPEEIAAIDAIWDSVVPKHKWTWEDEIDGEILDDYYEMSNGEYARIANAYEHSLGL